MRILNTKQIKELDAYTLQQEGIPSVDLMERACKAFVHWFVQRIEPTKKIGVVCGTGNNGGDGLGIARLLEEWGYPVKVWIVRGLVPESPDFKTNLERIKGKVKVTDLIKESDPGLFSDREVLIDAVFGAGLSRPPEGIYAQTILSINETEVIRIAVDIPSGLSADGPSSGAIVKAHYTLSFELPKLAFFLPQSHPFTGEWVLVDIGLNKKFIREASSPYRYTRLQEVRKIIRARSKYDHKGTFGHALIIAGSYGKNGAAILASRAALRAGLGLLTVHIPECGYQIIQTAVPEAMAEVDKDFKVFSEVQDLSQYTTLGIGPGLGQDDRTKNALAKVLEAFKKPLVIDADALNILAANRHLLPLIPPGSILTPHVKEFERLVGPWKDDFERLEKQIQLASSLQSIIVLKGAHTSIATEKGMVYFNSTGNPGMATGGTGDVLTGIITGLLAQQYSPEESAIAGVFLHGLAGDLAITDCGKDSLIASDLIDYLARAFLKVTRK